MAKSGFSHQTHAAAFQSPKVAKAYQNRPVYTAETFDVLEALLKTPSTSRILDIGCGTGFIARELVDRVAHVDAVDISSAMIAEGKKLPQGNHPNLNWLVASTENVALKPPYDLITAGDSLHWMSWNKVFPRFAKVLKAEGLLAILTVKTSPPPWQDELMTLIKKYSTHQDFKSVDTVEQIKRLRFFEGSGRHETKAETFEQSLEAYIESFHGRASFSRDLMTQENAAAFDTDLKHLVSSFTTTVKLEISSRIVWGKPKLKANG